MAGRVAPSHYTHWARAHVVVTTEPGEHSDVDQFVGDQLVNVTTCARSYGSTEFAVTVKRHLECLDVMWG